MLDCPAYGPLAQLVAHLHDAQGVTGSSPVRPTRPDLDFRSDPRPPEAGDPASLQQPLQQPSAATQCSNQLDGARGLPLAEQLLHGPDVGAEGRADTVAVVLLEHAGAGVAEEVGDEGERHAVFVLADTYRRPVGVEIAPATCRGVRPGRPSPRCCRASPLPPRAAAAGGAAAGSPGRLTKAPSGPLSSGGSPTGRRAWPPSAPSAPRAARRLPPLKGSAGEPNVHTKARSPTSQRCALHRRKQPKRRRPTPGPPRWLALGSCPWTGSKRVSLLFQDSPSVDRLRRPTRRSGHGCVPSAGHCWQPRRSRLAPSSISALLPVQRGDRRRCSPEVRCTTWRTLCLASHLGC